eukprot:4694257-Amphidinium_carterae.1
MAGGWTVGCCMSNDNIALLYQVDSHKPCHEKRTHAPTQVTKKKTSTSYENYKLLRRALAAVVHV